MMIRTALLLVLLLASYQSSASDDVYKFDNAQQEKVYNKLIVEFRCLVCQNQNIADSDADLAKDLRAKTHELLLQGKTENEIKEFMRARYGDFVLYTPPLNTTTWWLWSLPVIVLVFALVGVFFSFRKFKKEQAS
jgi:cytochrome c-type biogenesis protein CcmH